MSIIHEFDRLDPKVCVSDFGPDHTWRFTDAAPAGRDNLDDDWVQCIQCDRVVAADLAKSR